MNKIFEKYRGQIIGSVRIPKRTRYIHIEIRGINKFWAPWNTVRLKDFGTIVLSREGMIYLKRSIHSLHEINQLSGTAETGNFYSNWGIFKADRKYFLALMIPIEWELSKDFSLSHFHSNKRLNKTVKTTSKIFINLIA